MPDGPSPDWHLMKQFCLIAMLSAAVVAGCASHAKFAETEPATAPAPEPSVAAAHPGARPMPHMPYSFPLVSIGEKFNGLPPAVQNTIRAQVGTLPLTDIVKDTSSGATVYKIYFENEELFPPLHIAPDGSVLNPDLTVAVAAPEEMIGIASGGGQSLKTSDLPAPAMKTIQERAPSAEIARIAKEVWNGHDVYIISFKDPGHNPKLYISPDGTLAGGTHRP
jgi:hypothetical protein